MERGISLVPLIVTGLSTGLYGRACVTVGDPKGRPLPAHHLSAGDQVRLHSTKESKGSKGSKGSGTEEGLSEISGGDVCLCRYRPPFYWRTSSVCVIPGAWYFFIKPGLDLCCDLLQHLQGVPLTCSW